MCDVMHENEYQHAESAPRHKDDSRPVDAPSLATRHGIDTASILGGFHRVPVSTP